VLQWADPAVAEIQRMHADMLALLASGGSNRSDYLLPLPDGRTVHFHGAARAFALPNGAAGGLVATAADFSEERARQQELADARDKAESATLAKSAFLATMSHEIRTPMNGVLGMLELLSHTPLNLEQRNSVAVAQESGRSLLTLLSDVLDLSKIEANRLTIEAAPASLRSVAELVIQTLANGARAKGLKVRLFIAPNVASGHVFDALRVRQILFNLLGNAIKFTRQGWVSLRITATDEPQASPPGQHIVFEVSDSGIGIAPQAQARLFAPFEQAEPSVSREFGGTGLGLAICQRLSDLMGAQLSIDSQLGQGATLRLEARFPVVQRLPLAEPLLAGTELPVKVLILCDDGADQDALTAYLGARQFDALVPSLPPANAQQLAQLLRAQLPQCAIVLPALLERLGIAPGALGTLLRQSGAAVVEPVVVCLSDFQQGQPLAQRQLYNQPILPSAVSALLGDWRAAGEGPRHLPTKPTAPASAASSASSALLADAAADAPRILVAEDHPTNQAVVSKQLEMMGCTVTLCGDGESAFAAWRTACQTGAVPFNALLVDCHMPVMDGYALARQIRSAEAAAGLVGSDGAARPHVPIIALTADTTSGVRLQCAQAGMDDLLTKPVDIPGLRATLGRWITSLNVGVAHGEGAASPACAPDSAAESATKPAFDFLRLVGEMGGRDAADRLMVDYVDCTGQDIVRLAAAAHDAPLARRMAHRIKGAARLAGATQIEQISARLEATEPASSLTADTVSEACAGLVQALENVRVELANRA
jgi:signal transduction histidine kinase/CheY-like chemotaxis protein